MRFSSGSTAIKGPKLPECATHGTVLRKAALLNQCHQPESPQMIESFVKALNTELTAPFLSIGAETVIVRLLAAILLGGVIGLEREIAHRPAGLRTHMMISLAAALFAILTFELMAIPEYQSTDSKPDPLRLIEAVTAGVAFLAAGTIFTSRGQVAGLTTGAGMWLAGAIGLACGIGHLPLAIMGTGLALVVLWLVGFVNVRQGQPVNADNHENKGG